MCVLGGSVGKGSVVRVEVVNDGGLGLLGGVTGVDKGLEVGAGAGDEDG